jgi:hypothetical protein
MIITVIHRAKYRIVCDHCGETEVYFKPTWKDAFGEMKSDGWWTCKIDDNWKHFCCEVCFLKERDDA